MEVTTLDMERALRLAGLRVTRVRTTVLAAVRAHPHAFADVVVEVARRTLPDLSRQAVHDSLRALVEVGLVRRFQLGAQVRFEAQTGDEHHHVVCTSCGQIADVVCGDGLLGLAPADSRGFRITAAEVVFHGLCPDCAGRSDERPQRLVVQASASLPGPNSHLGTSDEGSRQLVVFPTGPELVGRDEPWSPTVEPGAHETSAAERHGELVADHPFTRRPTRADAAVRPSGRDRAALRARLELPELALDPPQDQAEPPGLPAPLVPHGQHRIEAAQSPGLPRRARHEAARPQPV